jgi:hypothetical protein
VRTSQIDANAVDNTPYCYAVFAFDHHGNYSLAAVDPRALNPGDVRPPQPVTGLHVEANSTGDIVLTWRNPPGLSFVSVRRGPGTSCPTGQADGTQIGGESVRRRQVDTSVQPGVTYCYRVFAMDAASNVAPGNSSDIAAPKPAPQVTAAQHPAGNGGSQAGWLTPTLTRTVAGVGLTMLLVMAAATAVRNRRSHTSAYVPARELGPRVAMNGYAPVALVIPALLVLGSCVAIGLVLLNL